MSTSPPSVVLVVWEDIKTSGVEAWVENKDEPYAPHLVYQVGYLLRDEPEFVRITQAWHPDLIAPTDTIPRGCIRSMTVLKTPKLRKR
jgi:hypothetical protein